MSFRNGDKSREHRLRKGRQKKREKTRSLQTGKTDGTGHKSAAAKK